MQSSVLRVTAIAVVALGLFATGCGVTDGGGQRVDVGVGAGQFTATAPPARHLDLSNPRVRLRSRSEAVAPTGPLEGSPAQDLVYTPIYPCRIVDTRVPSAIGGDLAANETRSFYATDFTDPIDTAAAFASQGGSTPGCQLKFGIATAIMVNFTMVTPGGTGYLRAWASDTPPPLATLVNYNSSLNVSNGIAVPICNPYVSICDTDFTLKTFSAKTHLVVDVVGFFSYSLPPGVLTPKTAATSADLNIPHIVGVCTKYTLSLPSQSLEPWWAGDMLVEGQVTLVVAHTTGVEDRVDITAAWTKTVGSAVTVPATCNQAPCTTSTGSQAVVGAAQPTGTVVLTVPVRCDVPVSFTDIQTSDTAIYLPTLVGTQSSGGPVTVDRISFTSTFTSDWTAQ